MVWNAISPNGLEWIMTSSRNLHHVFLLQPLLFLHRFHFCPSMQIVMKKMHAVVVDADVVDIVDDVVDDDSEICTAREEELLSQYYMMLMSNNLSVLSSL